MLDHQPLGASPRFKPDGIAFRLIDRTSKVRYDEAESS